MQQTTTLTNVASPLQGVAGVDKHWFREPALVDDALYYPIYLFIDKLVFLTVYYDLYSEVEKRERFNECQQPGREVLAVF